jgi:uncharacterized protein (TIGR03032 family)
MSSENASSSSAQSFKFAHDERALALLRELGLSLACTTYQAGKIVLLRAGGDRISALLRSFDWASGLAENAGGMALGTRCQIWLLRNERDIAKQLVGQLHDACFVPRQSYVTGDIRVHDLAWSDGSEPTLWFVNTRFSCLCTLDPKYSFVPRWQPPFISALVPDDHCHLNGLAMRDGRPRYVTALGETNTREGWRPAKAHGGVIIDVPGDNVISRHLSMPHSPRFYRGHLYVLNSGFGDLEVVDLATGLRDNVARLPGYTRGLAFHGDYAFVGLSKVREQREFGELPIQQLGNQIRCGIWIVNLVTGTIDGSIEFLSGIEEVFAVEALTDMRYPTVVGFEKDLVNGIYVLPIRATADGGSVDEVMATLGNQDSDAL